jgi:O86/O127-antigen biosynthesis beta-1,3-galactosyltransferase
MNTKPSFPSETIDFRPFSVEILMPVHGEGKYLQNAIDSTSGELNENVTLTIVFDRPHKKALEVVESFSAKHPGRVKTLESKIPGVANALNLGLRHSGADLIARFDSDDIMIRDRIKAQTRKFRINPTLVLHGMQASFIDEFGKATKPYRSCNPITHRAIISQLHYRNPLIHPSVMFKRTYAVQVGGYNPELEGVEDYDLWIRLSQVGQAKNSKAVGICYRFSENQSSRKIEEKNTKIKTILLNQGFVEKGNSFAYLDIINIIEEVNELSSFEKYSAILKSFLALMWVNPRVLTSYVRFRILSHLQYLSDRRSLE